jgi:hypothetical protein
VPIVVIRLNQPMVKTMQDARLYILQVLRNRLALMSQPMVEKALTLAKEHGITVEQLIKEAREIAQNV